MTSSAPSRPQASLRRAVLLLCFLSGASSLIYQVVWMRMLTFTFGVSSYATVTVLCAFMAGLALGSWGFRGLADRAVRLLPLYAALEIGIGAFALVLPVLLEAVTRLSIQVHALTGGSPLAVNLGRFLLAGILLALPASFMGGTVPVLSRFFIRQEDRIGKDAALFYAVNTFGAVAGVLAAGFVLVGTLGMLRTTLVAVGTNAVVALLAWLLGRWERGAAAAPRAGPVAPPGRRPGATEHVGVVMAVFALAGFVSLAYEVLWTRLLIFYLHNSTYAFSAMLVVFLFGIAAGSLLMGGLVDRLGSPLRALAALEVMLGATSLVSVVLYTRLPELAGAFVRLLPVRSFAAATALIFFQAGLILLVPTLLMGAAFPLAARAVTRRPEEAGGSVGAVYAANTLGTIGGAFLCGFLLIPRLGLGPTAMALIITSVLLAVPLLALDPPSRTGAKAAWGTVMLAIVISTPILVPEDLFRQAFEDRFARVLYYRDEATDTVAVAETQPGNLDSRTIFYADGRGTAGIFSVPENRVSGHLPMLVHPDPRDVLVICFGVGNSLAAVARHPASRIHCVELSPGVIETARFFTATNRGVLEDPRVRLFIEDGRIHLLTTSTTYDVVTLEPPEMHTAGVVNLYTREFYALVRGRLNPGGVVCQWLNIRKMPEEDLRRLIAAFREVFPHTTLWQPPKCFGLLLLGTWEPFRLDLPGFLDRFRRAGVFTDLAEIRMGDPYDFLSQFMMGEERTVAYVGSAPPVTDDHTAVDFSVPRSVMSDYGVTGFFAGLDLQVAERRAGRSSTQAGYAKIRRLSRERESIEGLLDGIPRAGQPLAEIRAALAQQTEAKRHWCDDYGID